MVCRTFKRGEYCNISYAFTIILLFTFYILFCYEFLFYRNPSYKIPIFIAFTILAILTFWSFFTTVFTQPGRVPFYWGLYQQNNLKNRKYCLLCHGFKPERCHHCSTCQKCVLNMDHHCPWVNNCIGFHNRKFFILFLFYISLCLLIISIIGVIQMIEEIKKVSETNETDIHFAIKILITLGSIPLFFALLSFLIFHLKMIFANTTTLQGMIQRKEGVNEVEDYDVGNYENFVQVFGQNGFYWPIPVYGDGPKGNGINWPRNNVKNNWNSETKTLSERANKKM